VIDVNVSLHRWPFRRLACDDPAGLVSCLREKGVTQAWAGSFDGVLHRDIAAVNARLAMDCQKYGAGLLLPFGEIHPKLPDWREDLRRCHEVHRMPGIRLHPNYHGYTLDDPACAELLEAAARRGLIVQIALLMEDERTQHPLLRVAPVNPAPLAERLQRVPSLKVVLLNGGRSPEFHKLAAAGAVYFDIATVEGVGGVARFAEVVTPERVLFGSHFPFFYFDAAVLKIKEAGLPEDRARAITDGNARALLKR
jgi:predicted TIM-barrel fold metal-dependent hydrolase